MYQTVAVTDLKRTLTATRRSSPAPARLPSSPWP